jgi:hypothetical protein
MGIDMVVIGALGTGKMQTKKTVRTEIIAAKGKLNHLRS